MEEQLKKLIQEAVSDALSGLVAMPTTQTVPDIMTVKDLAAYMQVSESWVLKNVRRIPRLNVVGTRFRKADIDAWLDEQVVESSDKEMMHFTKGTAKSKSKNTDVYKVV